MKVNDMTEFAKQTYKDMSTADRVRMWLIKSSELFELSELMTKEDIKFLKMAFDAMKEDEHDKH